MRIVFAVLLLCLPVPVQAAAKPVRHGVDAFNGDRWAYVAQAGTTASDVNRTMRCPPPHCGRAKARKSKQQHRRRPTPGYVTPLTLAQGFRREIASASSMIIGGRPAGCPSRFCGCGASLHLFGRIIPSLNLAANWLRFPRTSPAPNMVAARRGHVFVLKQHIAGNVWLAYDANSGGRRTRIHPRSIAGYSIVNPRGT